MAGVLTLSCEHFEVCGQARKPLVSRAAFRGKPLPSKGPHLRRSVLARSQVVAFTDGILKRLGLGPSSKPGDRESLERKAVLEGFFSDPGNGEVYDQLLAQDFQLHEDGSRVYTKQDFKDIMLNNVLPAIPDFKWTAATDGVVDKGGFAIVLVQATGHHTGAALVIPGREDLPPVTPRGRRLSTKEGVLKVKVEGGKIRAISVLAQGGAGFLVLYRALAGEEAALHAAPGAGKASYD
ncbi:hypothetical protein N2152v2_006230 [Parachlorella kessleri]